MSQFAVPRAYLVIHNYLIIARVQIKKSTEEIHLMLSRQIPKDHPNYG